MLLLFISAIWKFLVQRSCKYFHKIIFKGFVFCVVESFFKGHLFLISILKFALLAYVHTIGLYILILYPVNLLNPLINSCTFFVKPMDFLYINYSVVCKQKQLYTPF